MDRANPARCRLWIRLFFLFASVGCLVAALSQLPLFQDGAHYFISLYVSQTPSMPHGRYAAALFQLPALSAVLLGAKMPSARAFFSIGYAAVPLLSLSLSWLVIRKRAPEMIIWPALFVLIANAVNFSRVSELLIALQLSIPLFLVLLLSANSKSFWACFVVLVPLVFNLHPLSFVVFAVLGLAAWRLAVQGKIARSPGLLIAACYAALAAGRLVWTSIAMSDYERRYTLPKHIFEYFVTSAEDRFLFVGVCLTGVLLLFGGKKKLGVSLWLIFTAALVVGNIRLSSNLSEWFAADREYSIASGVALAIAISFMLHFYSRTSSKLRIPPTLCMGAVMVTVGILTMLSQYGHGGIVLKTGGTLIVFVILMLFALSDRSFFPLEESNGRLFLSGWMALLFVLSVSVQANVWMELTGKLKQTVDSSPLICTSLGSPQWIWLSEYPGKAINNWSLPSLAFALHQSGRPRFVLDSHTDCEMLEREGTVKLTRWSSFQLGSVESRIE